MTLTLATLAIGDELLDGRLADTNSQRLAEALFEVGLSVSRSVVVDDDAEEIAEAATSLAGRYDVIVTSGGLGPTTDDLTAEALARAAGCGVRLDEGALKSMEERFAERGMSMPANNRRQAEVPETAICVQNGAGISPAFITRVGAAEIWSFPGVPSEYDWFVAEHLLPTLRERIGAPDERRRRRTLRCLGITESALGHALEDFEAAHPAVRVQYRTRFPENHVRIVAEGTEEHIEALTAEARAAIGGAVYAVGEAELEELVLDALKARGATVALAESCTGGLVCKRLTDVPGSSAAVAGGVVSYSNTLKIALLGVEAALLDEHGAVSEEVAAAMAEGARVRLGATWALSITGVAGPGGGTEDKPVGTVCFGLSGPAGTKTKRRFLPLPGRERVRSLSAAVSLRWLLKELQAAAEER